MEPWNLGLNVLFVAAVVLVTFFGSNLLDRLYTRVVRKVTALRGVIKAASAWAAAENELREEHLRTKPGEHVIANEGHVFKDRGGLYRYCTRCKRRLTAVNALIYTMDGLPPCRPEPDEYERHAITTRCDYTEDELLAAVKAARDAGVRL